MIPLCGMESGIRDWCKMGRCLTSTTVFIPASAASAGECAFDKSEADRRVIAPRSRQADSPLYGGILNFPDLRP